MPSNPGGLVYGPILVATLLAAESVRRETYPRTAGAVALSLVIYWLSMSYAEYTGHRASESHPFEARGYLAALRHELAVIVGALGPLAVLLVGWAAGASLATAVTIGVWTAVGVIVATEIVIGVRSDLEGRELVLQTAFGALLGGAVLALRVLLH